MSTFRRLQTVLKLSSLPGIGPAKARSVLEAIRADASALEYVLEYDRADLVALGFSDDQADVFLSENVHGLASAMEDAGVGLVTILDSNLPPAFQHPRLSPWFFYRGDLNVLDGDRLAFSGSRDASDLALRITNEISGDAAGAGFCIVSGGARGVDTAAHVAALESGGTTAIVLAQGLAGYRLPPEFDSLHALVLSEFAPLDGWSSYRAMQRNKSIIHLSDQLIIPQTGEQGGTRNAGEYALKNHHPTWVLDLGDAHPGNARLIRDGAWPLEWARGQGDIRNALTPPPDTTPMQSRLL